MIKVSDSIEFSVALVVTSPGSLAVAEAGGGGGGATTFVCMSPASADRESTKSSVVAAQSCLSFSINVAPERQG